MLSQLQACLCRTSLTNQSFIRGECFMGVTWNYQSWTRIRWNDLLDDMGLAPWSATPMLPAWGTLDFLWLLLKPLVCWGFRNKCCKNSALNSWVFPSGLIWGLSWCELTLSSAYFRSRLIMLPVPGMGSDAWLTPPVPKTVVAHTLMKREQGWHPEKETTFRQAEAGRQAQHPSEGPCWR